MVADNVTHPVCEDLSTTAGHRVHSGRLHALQGFGNRHLAAFGEKRYFYHSKRFDMHLRGSNLQPPCQLHEVFKWKIRMESPSDMKLRHSLREARSCGLPSLLKRPGIGARFALLASERTKTAGRHADVSRIDVPVYIKVGNIPMHPFPDQICQPAYG